jgi:hypothetical protein
MSDIRIYAEGFGVITREQAIFTIATGRLPEDFMLSALSEAYRERYLAAGPSKRDEWAAMSRLSVADGEVNDEGTWTPGASTVEIYSPGILDAEYRISTGGTSRPLSQARVFAQVQMMAIEIVETGVAARQASEAMDT